MTVHLNSGGVIALEGVCPSEDAETLLQHLAANADASIDWRTCESAHSAVIQVLLAARPRMLGTPAGRALADWIAPLLT